MAVTDGRQHELQAESTGRTVPGEPAAPSERVTRSEPIAPAERVTRSEPIAPSEPAATPEPTPPTEPTEPTGRLGMLGRVRRSAFALPVAGLAVIALLTPLHGLWAIEAVLTLLLLVVPGVILLRALRVDGETVAANPIYVPAAAILVLFCSGLGVDLVGPLVGISEPLRAVPVLVALLVVCAALLAASRNAPAEVEIPWGLGPQPIRLAWPLLLPLLGAWGALRLNNGHTAHVAAFAGLVVIVALIATFLLAPRWDDALLKTIVFATALALMWSFSLRGSLVYGFDISSEYYSLSQTVTTGVWHFSHPNDAYGAMLSLTIFPAQLHALSGISALQIFKVVFPVIGAFFPVAVFSLARRALDGRWSFMAAALVIMQQTFFQELTALARQEIAMVLFAALMCAVLDTSLTVRVRWSFVCLLSVGMVLAHYSTAYLAIPLLAIAAAIQWGASWFRPVPRVAGIALLACVVSASGATIWYGALTHSTSNMSQFVQAAEGAGLNLLPNSGANVLATYLQGESSHKVTPAQYQRLIASTYRTDDSFIVPLANADQAQYDLKAANVPSPPVSFALGANAMNLADLLIQQLVNLLAAVAAAVMALRRQAPLIARQIGLLGLAGTLILILVRVSGTIAQEYNPQRAFLQLLIVLGIGICWLCQLIGARWARGRPALLAIGAATIGLYLLGTGGLAGEIFGGGTPANLGNSGADYQEFVMTGPDVAGADWVAENAPIGQFIYADNYAHLRLDTAAGPNRPGVFDAITPETLDQHGWVYADSVNVKQDVVRSLLGNDVTSYAFPWRFLNSNYDVVYTNGSSEVFHR